MENETGLKLKYLRADNDGEYEIQGFKQYCSSNVIRFEKTIPETPQLNGVAERMNKTLGERARSMRLHSGLSQMIWSDAVNTVAYLIDRSPSVPLQLTIPEEAWRGKAVTLSHFRTFGWYLMFLLSLVT